MATEKSYLDIMLGYYHDGKYLDTSLDLMCQQSDMDRITLTTLLLETGINFRCHIKYFKFNTEDGDFFWKRSKLNDYIVLSKTGKP
jgi:hypothetical protein